MFQSKLLLKLPDILWGTNYPAVEEKKIPMLLLESQTLRLLHFY